MALINCPECGKEISDTVKSCPNCGFKISKAGNKTGHKKIYLTIGVIIVIAIACVLFFMLGGNSKEQKYYEDITYNCIEKYRDELEIPNSFVFKDITFYQGIKDIPFEMQGMKDRFESYKERSQTYPICMINAIHETNTGVAIEVYAQFYYDEKIQDYTYSGEYLADDFNDSKYLDSIELTVNKVYFESSVMLNKYFNKVGEDVDLSKIKKEVNN